MSVNQCNFLGNLTRDPEMRYTPNNTAVTSFGLALNHRYKNSAGEQKEEVTFIDCEAWGKTGEIISQYHKKGSQIYVTCRAKLDSWEDKDSGQKRSKMKFVVENFSFVGGKSGNDGQGESQHGTEDQTRRQPQQNKPTNKAKQTAPPQDTGEEDERIPF